MQKKVKGEKISDNGVFIVSIDNSVGGSFRMILHGGNSVRGIPSGDSVWGKSDSIQVKVSNILHYKYYNTE